MVAIFTGAGTGLERGSGTVLGSAGLLGSAALGRGGEMLYLNAATGNLVISQQDEFLVGRGPDAAISRTYNSQGNFSDENGDNWRQSTHKKLTWGWGEFKQPGSAVRHHLGDGSEVMYHWNGADYVATDGAGAHDKLTYIGAGWRWTDGGGQVTEIYSDYADHARLTEQGDTSGNKLSFSYSGDKLTQITTADGSWIQYHWAGNNIAQIHTGFTDVATGGFRTQTRTRYGYDHLNRLTAVTVDLTPEDNHQGADGYTTNYGYHGDSRRIAWIAQTDGSRVDFGYDGAGRITKLVQVVAAGETRSTEIAYDEGSTSITDASGQVTRLEYDPNGNLRKIASPPAVAGGAPQVVQFTYNAKGDLTSVADATGAVTRYSHDDRGNVIREVDPLGNVITRTYGAHNELLTETRMAGVGRPVALEDFESGAALGWVLHNGQPAPVSGPNGAFTHFLGRFGGRAGAEVVSKSFALDPIAERTTIEFDFLKIDSWDGLSGDGSLGEEKLTVFINGAAALSFMPFGYGGEGQHSASGTLAVGPFTGSYVITSSGADAHLGFNGGAAAPDRVYRVLMELDGAAAGLKLGFGSSIDQHIDDESFGIDNLRIQQGLLAEHFEDGSSANWMLGNGQLAPISGTSGAFSRFLGRFGGTGGAEAVSKTFSLNPSIGKTRIEFDFLKIDSWDAINGDSSWGEEKLTVFIDGAAAFSFMPFGWGPAGFDSASGTFSAGPFTGRYFVTSSGVDTHQGFNAAWYAPDRVYRVSIELNGAAAGMKLGFGSTLDQHVDDEAFGIDNVRVFQDPVVDDFENGTPSGWTWSLGGPPVSEATAQRSGGFSRFLGRFSGTGGAETISKVYTLNAGLKRTEIEFDFLKIDSWDHHEQFHVFLNGGKAFTFGPFAFGVGQQEASGQFVANGLTGTYQVTSSGADGELGFTNDWGGADRTYRMRLDVHGTGESIRLGFGANFDQWLDDEAFGIDNVRVGQLPDRGETTRYVYDANNRLTFTVSAEGRVSKLHYNASGQVASTVDYPGHRFDVSALGGSTALHDWQLLAWEASLPDKSGIAVVNIFYDARGNVRERIGYAGTTVAGAPVAAEGYSHEFFAYDHAGRLLSRSTASVLAGLVVPGREAFVYDGLGRLIASTDLNGASTRIAFRDAANQTIVTLANGFVKTSTFNKAGELIAETEAGDYVAGGTDSYGYDQLGRLRIVTDATGRRTYYLYDATGRKTADISHNGHLIEYGFDAADRLISTTRYALAIRPDQLTALANPDAAIQVADIRPEARGEDVREWHVFDAAGRLLQSIDGDGSVTAYEYDMSDRLIRTTAFVNRLSAAQLAGLRTSPPAVPVLPPSAPADSVARTFYDKDGHIVGSLDGEGYLTSVTYDGAGRKTAEIAFSRATRAELRHGATLKELQAAQEVSAADRTTRYAHDGLGRLRFMVDALGHLTEYAYDGAGPQNVAGAPKQTIRHAASLRPLPSYTVASIQAALQAQARYGPGVDWTAQNGHPGGYRVSGNSIERTIGGSWGSIGEVTSGEKFPNAIVSGRFPVSGGEAAFGLSDDVTPSDGASFRKIDAGFYKDPGNNVFCLIHDNFDRQTLLNVGPYDPFARYSVEIARDRMIWRRDGVLLHSAASPYSDGRSYRLIAAATGVGSRVDDLQIKSGWTAENGNPAGYRVSGVSIERTIAGSWGNVGEVTSREAYSQAMVSGMLQANGGEEAFGLSDDVTPSDGASFRKIDAGFYKDPNNIVHCLIHANSDAMTLVNIGALDPKASYSVEVASGRFVWRKNGEVRHSIAAAYSDNRLYRLIAAATGIGTRIDDLRIEPSGGGGNRIVTDIYDGSGRLVYSIDPADAVTAHSYDPMGRISKSVQFAKLLPAGFAPTQASMDHWTAANGSAADRVTRNYYSDRGELRFVVDAEGYVTRHDHDAEGRLTRTLRFADRITVDDHSSIDGVDRLASGAFVDTRMEYDGAGRLAWSYDGEGNHRHFAYNANGTLAWDIAMLGTSQESRAFFEHDAAGRVVAEHKAWGTPDVGVTRYGYDGHGNVVTITDPNGNVTRREHDRLGRLTAERDAENYLTSYAYNAFGDTVRATDGRGHSTYSYHDRLGRVTHVRDTEDFVTETAYTVFGEVDSVTRRYNRSWNPDRPWELPGLHHHDLDATTRFEYDRLGRVTKVTDAEGAFERYTLNAFGQRTEVRHKWHARDPHGAARAGVTLNQYDRRGLLVAETLPMSSVNANGTPSPIRSPTVSNMTRAATGRA